MSDKPHRRSKFLSICFRYYTGFKQISVVAKLCKYNMLGSMSLDILNVEPVSSKINVIFCNAWQMKTPTVSIVTNIIGIVANEKCPRFSFDGLECSPRYIMTLINPQNVGTVLACHRQ